VHERRFAFVLFGRVVTEIDMWPAGGGGSRVRYRLTIAANGWVAAVLLRVGFLPAVGRTIDRIFRRAAGFAEGIHELAFEPSTPAIAGSTRQRVTVLAQGLAGRGYPAAERLAAHLLGAAETDLERTRPRALARRWGTEPREVVETCLAAAREGLLVLHWDLLCPRCRGAKVSVTSLDRLPEGAHCPSCNIDYSRDFARNVEVTFEPEPNVRALAAGTIVWRARSPVSMSGFNTLSPPARRRLWQSILPTASIACARSSRAAVQTSASSMESCRKYRWTCSAPLPARSISQITSRVTVSCAASSQGAPLILS
jgi:hypothetical protein